MQPNAIMTCGIPGSGKTHVRDLILKALPDLSFDLVAPDDMIEAVCAATGGFYRDVFADHRSRKVCYDAAWYRLHEALHLKSNLILDRTHLDEAQRAKALLPLQEAGYHIIAVAVEPPGDIFEWIKRLDSRQGKDIPPGTLFSMARSYTRPGLVEGFDEVFYGPSDDELVKQVVSYIRESAA